MVRGRGQKLKIPAAIRHSGLVEQRQFETAHWKYLKRGDAGGITIDMANYSGNLIIITLRYALSNGPVLKSILTNHI